MRVDPKHFNLFMLICAVLTLIIIIYSTVRYSQKQTEIFGENILYLTIDTLALRSYTAPDSLYMKNLKGNPVVLQFWATWSEKSDEVNRFLRDYQDKHDSLKVIFAAVRDADREIHDYLDAHRLSNHVVEGTDLFHQIETPGIPSQLFISKRGEVTAYHVGNELDEIERALDRLLDE